jgi:hypothetical protein
MKSHVWLTKIESRWCGRLLVRTVVLASCCVMIGSGILSAAGRGTSAKFVKCFEAAGFSEHHAQGAAPDVSWRAIRVGQTPSPGVPCGAAGSGCVGTVVTRIPPTSHPCGGIACGSTSTCSGTGEECGRCYFQPCTAVSSAWVASPVGVNVICSNGAVQSGCAGLIDSRGKPSVLREEFVCILMASGCHCDPNGGSTKVPCPCAIPAGQALINPCP